MSLKGGESMEQSDTERAEYLLRTIEMIVTDAEQEANTSSAGSSVNFSAAYSAIAELREVIEEAL